MVPVRTVGAIIVKWKGHNFTTNQSQPVALCKTPDRGAKRMIRRVLQDLQEDLKSAGTMWMHSSMMAYMHPFF